MNKSTDPRRNFLKKSAVLGTISFLPPEVLNQMLPDHKIMPADTLKPEARSIIGNYGPWAAGIPEDPPLLSFRNSKYTDLESWRTAAINKARELVSAPDLSDYTPEVKTISSHEYDGLVVEELQWQLPYGRTTEAIFLKPAGSNEQLPGVLGLHDHGGQKYFGKRKITRTSENQHPIMHAHQQHYYSGKAWANELAKRGYAVLVHDTFTFGSRRVFYQDVSGITYGACRVDDKSDENPEVPENIEVYNQWAGSHEHIMAKSLFCGGTTWPGVTLVEDQVALDILAARNDVDGSNLGCCGLSGGGLRTDYLGGLDHRIKCAISVGFMSTWNDFLLNKSYTHTWMTYAPLLPKYLDFPEILALRTPLPTMVMSDNEDQLYTLPEMKKSDQILKEVFNKAGAPDKYQGKFYPGEHKFDAQMQQDAFAWFDRWLK